MSTFKKTKVVMLPTNEKATMALSGNKLSLKTKALQEESQHLYFLSDEPIKEGDWFLMNNCIIRQCALHKGDVLDTMGGLHHESVCKKIIATTDKSLIIPYDGKTPISENWEGYKLPQPSQSFIEKFVEEYNKGNQITEVMVEYEDYDWDLTIRDNFITYQKLKINPKDNTITIRKAKDSWSREEVKQLFDKWNDTVYKGYYVGKKDLETVLDYLDKWIEENL